MRLEHAKHTTQEKALLLDRPFFNCADAKPGSFIRVNFYNLFWIFIIMSIVGLAAETVVSYFMDGFLKNRAGLVWGPFSPIYGAGAVLLTVALNKLKEKPATMIFVISGLIGGGFELCAGWIMEHAYGMVAWSYLDQPFNIGGYTCLGIAMVWGLAGFVWMRFALAPVVNLANMVPEGTVRNVATVLMAVFIGADIIMTLVSCGFWLQRMSGVPVETEIQMYFATHYPDALMENRFQTVSMYPELAG